MSYQIWKVIKSVYIYNDDTINTIDIGIGNPLPTQTYGETNLYFLDWGFYIKGRLNP